MKLFVGVDTLVEVERLRDEATDLYLSDGVELSFSVWREDEEIVLIGAEDVAMSYVLGSNGCYQGVLPSTVLLVEGCWYVLEITGTRAGATIYHEWRRCEAVRMGLC